MRAFEPVSSMADRKARVRWACDVSDSHYGDVDLRRIARAKGGDYSLWNKRASCRIPGCPGIVRFQDVSSMWPVKMDTITDRDPQWWALNDARRAELEALGYRVEMGKWVAPERQKPPAV